MDTSTVEAEIRALVTALVTDLQEVFRREVLRNLGVEVEDAPAPEPRKGRSARSRARADVAPELPPGGAALVDSPELPAADRVVALARDNPEAMITSKTIAETLALDDQAARALVMQLVRSGRVQLVDAGGMSRIAVREAAEPSPE